jgi:hypothetical protein
MLQAPKKPYSIRYVHFNHVSPFGGKHLCTLENGNRPRCPLLYSLEGGVGLREMFGTCVMRLSVTRTPLVQTFML